MSTTLQNTDENHGALVALNPRIHLTAAGLCISGQRGSEAVPAGHWVTVDGSTITVSDTEPEEEE